MNGKTVSGVYNLQVDVMEEFMRNLHLNRKTVTGVYILQVDVVEEFSSEEPPLEWEDG